MPKHLPGPSHFSIRAGVLGLFELGFEKSWSRNETGWGCCFKCWIPFPPLLDSEKHFESNLERLSPRAAAASSRETVNSSARLPAR